MTDKVLYFPYINVPNTDWFTRTLLYWDKVVSIVPSDQLQQLRPHMMVLVNEKLVEPVNPSRYIHQIPNFSESFLTYIRTRYSKRVKDSKSVVIHQEKINFSKSSFIKLHIEKSNEIVNELVKLGLAQRSDYPWCQVEKKVADAFMAYLAITLGKLEEVNAIPITDSTSSLEIISGKIHRNTVVKRNKVRDVILTKILPIPNQSVDLRDLIEFKQSHGQLLKNFRRKIESICIEIADLEELGMMEQQLQYKVDELDDNIKEIKDIMKNRWKQVTMGTLVPVLTAGMSLLTTPLNLPLACLGTGMSLLNAAYQAFDNEAKHKDNWNKPLAYAALAQSHFL
jgi:hypothetical protein